MLSGNETGWLLGDYILSQIDPGPVSEAIAVASSVVSSRMLATIARDHGATHIETPTGFKWLSRADADRPGCTLVYAYEEAIGHCVDPGAVRDKDGISAMVLVCDLVAALRDQGRTMLDALDELARRHGVHTTTAVSRRVADVDEAEAVMARLRATPPDRLAGFEVTATDLLHEPGDLRTDALLALAAEVSADVAIALDPDADRCAVAIPDTSGWRMLSGNETGWLLGDYILAQLDPAVARASVVASSVVSSQMLAAIAADFGAHHVETLTGFKWLARADTATPGRTLIYAYEEAIGHCVDPAAVRDKDGISAAVLVCDLVATLKAHGDAVPAVLDRLARRHGVHTTSAVTERVEDAEAVMARLRAHPPGRLGGIDVAVIDLGRRRGQDRTDALIFAGGSDGAAVRVAVRPSGTEPKIKGYLEIRMTPSDDLPSARAAADQVMRAVDAEVRALLG